jgi:hypothetical protein
MNSNEALQKINEIHQVIEGSNKAIFSGKRMIANGVLVTLIPLIEISTQFLTFGYDFGENSGLKISLIHTVFYWALFSLLSKLPPFKKTDKNQTHPLIRKAFSLGKPFLFSIIGSIIALSVIGQFQLIHPITLILIGLLFNLYGKFTIPAVSYIAWSYIILGIAYIIMSKGQIPNLWIYVTVYNGLSYVAMGMLLSREQRTT